MTLFLLGLVFTIPLAILANMLTPRAQTLWATYSSSQRDKQIAKLNEEKAMMKRFSEDASALTAFIAARLAFLMLFFSAVVIIMILAATVVQYQSINGTARVVILGLAFIMFTYASIRGMRYRTVFDNISSYKEYEAKIDKQIEDLQKIGRTTSPNT
jgi:ABC-type transport system involved in cytochrome bd biosynthesis fused ATPase/permease subunit